MASTPLENPTDAHTQDGFDHQISVEQTPNPETRKFLVDRPISPQGPLAFSDSQEATSSPLASALFKVKGVAGVFFGHHFISITKEPNHSWDTLQPLLEDALLRALEANLPLWEMPQSPENASSSSPNSAQSMMSPIEATLDENAEHSGIIYEIQNLLNQRIRPFVAQDGGDIIFESFKDGIVYLRLYGACQGCPSASATLKQGVENMLKHFVPEVQEVRAVTA